MNYIAYYRVSTKEQNLGIQAQQTAVSKFIKQDDIILATYVEKESGKKDNRIELTKAIQHCKESGSTLIIAKLDRLSRNVTFISQLLDSNLSFLCCDMPSANKFTIHIFAALAQQERELISSRTKAALAELKANGKVLGTPANLNDAHRSKGRLTVKANALEADRHIINYVLLLRETKTLREIATQLNKEGKTTRASKAYTQTQIKRMLDRHSADVNTNLYDERYSVDIKANLSADVIAS
jgi:DNA invertase Pin-like site-specific DNA recombinase